MSDPYFSEVAYRRLVKVPRSKRIGGPLTKVRRLRAERQAAVHALSVEAIQASAVAWQERAGRLS